jgi:hypothetical protein
MVQSGSESTVPSHHDSPDATARNFSLEVPAMAADLVEVIPGDLMATAAIGLEECLFDDDLFSAVAEVILESIP